MVSMKNALLLLAAVFVLHEFSIFHSTNAYQPQTEERSSRRHGNLYKQQMGSTEEEGEELPRNFREGNLKYKQKQYQTNRNQLIPNNYQHAPSNQYNTRTGLTRPNMSNIDRQSHKCRIWIPLDTFEKYEHAIKIQIDESNQLALVEVCCPDYGAVRLGSRILCRPICENCRNGYCVAPGECRCYEEFVSNDNGDCVFTCPLGCLNGQCYLDGSCICQPGFKLDETRKFCRPICSSACVSNPKHNCSEPEVCGCAKGYQLADDGCQPVCQPECGNGGTCLENNICECGPGFTNKDGVCQSDCYQKCDNGVCYGRNRCICNPGFTYHERSTQCVPI